MTKIGQVVFEKIAGKTESITHSDVLALYYVDDGVGRNSIMCIVSRVGSYRMHIGASQKS